MTEYVCMRCWNGIPEEWIKKRWRYQPDHAIGSAWCMSCYGMVRVAEVAS
jgi:hypothetical protein